jgi:hypothetical protein
MKTLPPVIASIITATITSTSVKPPRHRIGRRKKFRLFGKMSMARHF